MKRGYQNSILFLLAISLSFISIKSKQDQLSKKALERMDKALSKIWKGHQFSKEEVQIPDSIDKELEFHSQKNAIYVINNSMNMLGLTYIGRVNSCRIGGCASPYSDEKPTDHEHFDYMIVFEPQSLEIIKIEVLEYQATYGFEICSPGWLKQFVGYNGIKPLDYGDEIQALSGATISGIAITLDVEQVSKYMQSLRVRELI